MTRINANVPVELLSNRHLTVEFHEITRLNAIYTHRKNKFHKFDDIPNEFRLGSGHVKFFLDKGVYLKNRYSSLHHELIERGYNANKITNIFDFDFKHNKNYYSNHDHNVIILERMIEKMLHINIVKTWQWHEFGFSPETMAKIYKIYISEPSMTMHFLKSIKESTSDHYSKLSMFANVLKTIKL